MNVQDRQKLFELINPFIIQGMNDGLVNNSKIEKMIMYGTKISEQYNNDKKVVDLVNSILTIFDDKSQFEEFKNEKI